MNIVNLLMSGGPVVLVIILLSIYGAFVFFERWQKLRRAQMIERLCELVQTDIMAGNILAAIADAKRVDLPAARVIEAGLQRSKFGHEAVAAGLEETIVLEEERIGRGLSTLSTIAHVAPMLGLLGTVTGMIRAFHAFQSNVQASPTELAGGISEALVATATGLVVAILSHFGHNWLSALADRAVVQLERVRQLVLGWMIEAKIQRDQLATSRLLPEELPPTTASLVSVR